MVIKSLLIFHSTLLQFLLLPFNVKGNQMEGWMKNANEFFESYVDSFTGLTSGQQENFKIKKEHSCRVVENADRLSKVLNLNGHDWKVAYFVGSFSRYRQVRSTNELQFF